MNPNEYKTLLELDQTLHDPSRLDDDRAMAMRRLGNKPLRRLNPAEMRELIARNLGLPFLVPLAMERLAEEPFLEAQLHAGDLLTAVLEADTCFWIDNEELWCEMIPILEKAVERINARIQEEGSEDYLPWRLGDEFMAALLHFRSIYGNTEPGK